jgi:hypothetical protein
MKNLFTIGLLLMQFLGLSQSIHRCGTVELIKVREASNPEYGEATQNLYRKAQSMVDRNSRSGGEIYQIPVVFHIIYNTPDENLSDDLAHSQIARLNADYRRLNVDTTDTRAEFLPVAADTKIEFYLAGVDPDGNPTNGITHTETTRSDFAIDPFNPASMDEMKMTSTGGVASWDTEKYLNIWVCDLIGTSSFFQILGFAFPPSIAPNWPAGSAASSSEFEGVAIHYEVFGEGNTLSIGAFAGADMGRTAVHEVGHYLGLRHIWGDVLFGDGCTEDDGLEDTPNASANAGQMCNFASNTCVDTPVDFPDMIENYMDYAEEQCMNLFTEDQVQIMQWMLDSARTGLHTNPIEPSGIEDVINASDLSVFPNPATDRLTIQLSRNDQLSDATLIDLHGRTVAKLQVNSGPQQSFTAALPETPRGVYLLSLKVDGKRIQKRLILD